MCVCVGGFFAFFFIVNYNRRAAQKQASWHIRDGEFSSIHIYAAAAAAVAAEEVRGSCAAGTGGSILPYF